MGFLFLAELEGSTSHLSNGSSQSPIVKEIDTQRACSSPECTTYNCQSLPFGMTCEAWTQAYCRPSTSSTEASPARTSVRLELVRAWRESEADFISNSSALSEKQSQLSSSLRTSLQSGHADLVVWCGDFPSSGMTSGGQLYRPKRLAPRTCGKGGFSWPTPRANDSEKRGDFDANNPRNGLPAAVKRSLWPTPRASDAEKNQRSTEGAAKEAARKGGPQDLITAVQLWRTPCARDGTARGPSDPEKRKEQGHAVSLHDQVGGQLNPTWVEWLMGYPTEWTVCADWATPLYRRKREKRSCA